MSGQRRGVSPGTGAPGTIRASRPKQAATRRTRSATEISNVVPTYPGEWQEAWKPWVPGMLVAVEPMITVGTTETTTHGRDWPIWSADGSMAVHYEADVLITATGPRNLTAGLFDLPDVIAR